MKRTIEIHPLNAKGKYYIDQNSCTCSAACEYIAPNIFKYNNEDEFGYYVARQPENVEEEALCQEAIKCCPVEAILDDGEGL